MLIAMPMPDEFFRGHMARLAYINGIKTNEQYAALISKRDTGIYKGSKGLSLTGLSAVAIGMPINEYAFLHSLAPLTQFLCHEDSNLKQEYWDNSTISIKKTKLAISTGQYCDKCAEEDIGFWGFSYWRRSHQIPGNYWCEKHGLHPLKRVENGSTFERSPDHWESQRIYEPSFGVDQLRDSVYVHKFIDACQSILASRNLHLSVDIRKCLDQKLGRNLSGKSPKSRNPQLSNFIFDNFPIGFIIRVSKSSANKIENTYLSSIDGLVQLENLKKADVMVFILFCLSLFNTMDEFLNLLSNFSNQKNLAVEQPTPF